MGLKATIQEGVAAAEAALDDLKVPCKLIKRVPNEHVPGSPQTHTESSTDFTAVVIRYSIKEIIAQLAEVHDLRLIIFNQTTVPEANDVVELLGKRYRVVRSFPIYAGSETAVSEVQVRPLGV